MRRRMPGSAIPRSRRIRITPAFSSSSTTDACSSSPRNSRSKSGCRSRTVTSTPLDASWYASTIPAGPPPAMTTLHGIIRVPAFAVQYSSRSRLAGVLEDFWLEAPQVHGADETVGRLPQERFQATAVDRAHGRRRIGEFRWAEPLGSGEVAARDGGATADAALLLVGQLAARSPGQDGGTRDDLRLAR